MQSLTINHQASAVPIGGAMSPINRNSKKSHHVPDDEILGDERIWDHGMEST